MKLNKGNWYREGDIIFILDKEFNELIRIELPTYFDDEGRTLFDYCESCQTPIKQEEVEVGVFGCEFCKSPNNITLHEVNKK